MGKLCVRERNPGAPAVAQWVKGLVLSLSWRQLWQRSQLQLEFDPQPGNFPMSWVQPEKEKRKKREKEIEIFIFPSRLSRVYLVVFFFFFFSFPHTCSTWKFLGQEFNPSHSCNLRHSCGRAGFLTHCATWELQWIIFKTRDSRIRNIGY